MKKGRKPTLVDVARHAQVATITVSRALHNTGLVSQDVQERITASMAALGYVSRRTAKQQPAGTIAVLTGDLLNPFFPEIVRGVQDEADSYGMILTLYNLTDHQQRRQRMQRAAKSGKYIIDVVAMPLFAALGYRASNAVFGSTAARVRLDTRHGSAPGIPPRRATTRRPKGLPSSAIPVTYVP